MFGLVGGEGEDPFITVVVVVQEDQLSTVTGENLALKRENEALQLRLKRVRYLRRPHR